MKNNRNDQETAQNAGRTGEDYTAIWLESHGYSIVERNILLTAQVYLQKSPCALQPRFDVAAVTTLHGEPMGLKYFANAFGC